MKWQDLKKRGIVATKLSNMITETVLNKSDKSIRITNACIAHSAYDFGYSVHVGNLVIQKLPGEGEGWFESRKDALIYAANWLKETAWADSEIIDALNSYYSKLICSGSLFD